VKERIGGISKKEAGVLVNLLLDTVRNTLLEGENVKISGFGSFVVRGKRDRVGRNPHSGEELLIKARRVLTFKPSQLLRDRLNEEQ
jgi:integration host factor subunit alpha